MNTIGVAFTFVFSGMMWLAGRYHHQKRYKGPYDNARPPRALEHLFGKRIRDLSKIGLSFQLISVLILSHLLVDLNFIDSDTWNSIGFLMVVIGFIALIVFSDWRRWFA